VFNGKGEPYPILLKPSVLPAQQAIKGQAFPEKEFLPVPFLKKWGFSFPSRLIDSFPPLCGYIFSSTFPPLLSVKFCVPDHDGVAKPSAMPFSLPCRFFLFSVAFSEALVSNLSSR